MRIKKPQFTETLYTRISQESDNFIISYCTEHNQSKSEFVRDAVEHYINYLNHEANLKGVKEKLTAHRNPQLTDFDKVFNNEFFND